MPRTIIHVWSRDPALDDSDPAALEDALAKVRETGDVKALPLKEGKRPVIWKLTSLTEKAYRALSRTSAFEVHKAMADQNLRHVLMERATYAETSEATRRCLIGVEGALGADDRPFQIQTEGKERMLTEACMEALFERWGARLVSELGLRAIDACEVGPT